MIVFFIFLQLLTPIDSLKHLVEKEFSFNHIIELNRSFIKSRLFDSANTYLSKYAERFDKEAQAHLNYLIGDNLFFKTELVSAREQYLRTAARFSNTRYANNALERLYLFESSRRDTLLLKRFARAIYLFEINDLRLAEDSLKNLIKTTIGDYVLYYLSLLYTQKNEYHQALSALEQLSKDFPASRIYQAKILTAEMNFKIGREKEAVRILEDLVIKYPNLPVGIRARETLSRLKQTKND